jgi:excisionase family DNA binding protein
VGVIDEKESLKAISVEELEEQADEVGFLTPRELAKLLGVHPQQVYGWIRKGVLEAERCKCGRTIVDVQNSRDVLNKKARDLGRPEPYPSKEETDDAAGTEERISEPSSGVSH